MPASDVPGEQTSPTQPIPVKPPPIARVSYAPEDIVTAAETNAEHAAFCRQLDAAQRRALQRRAVHAVPVSRAGSAAAVDGAVPGIGRRRQLGRHGRRSGARAMSSSTRWTRRASAGLSSVPGADGGTIAATAIVGTTSRFQWSDGARRRRQHRGPGENAWPCQKPPWGNLAGGRTPRPAISRGACRSASPTAAGREAADRPPQHRRADHHRERARVHRRQQRSPLSRVRLADGQGALGDARSR